MPLYPLFPVLSKNYFNNQWKTCKIVSLRHLHSTIFATILMFNIVSPMHKMSGLNFFSCFSSVWKNSLNLILLEEMVKRVNESLTATFFWQDRLAKVITPQLLKISKTFAYKRCLDILTSILAPFFSSILSARCTKCHFQFLFLFLFCVKK